ncbi:MAG: hypothetical protein LBE59_10080 [Nevskiaceae bacterium]|jgi:hypothetical protein|nr:hypothetical protein [Nevskiaceae bacterium]
MKLWLALAAVCLTTPALAETIVVDGQPQLRPTTVQVPQRGSSMSSVEARFGQPLSRHATVGQPPITRWDYDGFSVYFEYSHVIHAVATR